MTPDIATLRRQLQQLQELHASGALDDAQFAQSRERLERLIVEQVMNQTDESIVEGAASAPASAPAVAPAPVPAPKAAAARPRPSTRLVALSSAFVLLVTVAGYVMTGSPALWDQRAGAPSANAAAADGAGGAGQGGHEVTMEQIEAMADGLRQRLETEPQNAEGWAMLGRSYSVLGRASDAVPAYRKAVELVPDDAGLLADLADSLAVTNNRQIAGEPMTFVQRALKIDPNQPKALSLAGTEAFLRGDFKAAAAMWERILVTQPADSPMAQQVRESINEARQRGGMPLLADGAMPEMPKGVTAQAAPAAAQTAAPAAPAAQPAAPGKTSVAGTVTLAPALAGKASPEDTVFVFARAAEGPRMPLAIVRKQVKDLPITFTLDDSSAMAPTMKLSNYPQVIVGARISKTGNAMPQPGDLQGLSQPVALGASGLKIVIGEEVGR